MIGESVMPGGTCRHKRHPVTAPRHDVDRLQSRSGRKQGSLPGVRSSERVGVEIASTRFTKLLQTTKVVRLMDALEGSHVRPHRRKDLQLVPEFGRQLGDTRHYSVDASLAFGVVPAIMERPRPTRGSDHGQHGASVSGGLGVLAPPVGPNGPVVDVEVTLGQALH